MQERPLISVIVPIYKVEPYLRQCLDSIVSQTYTNLEIILVDDGSPDGCPAICDEYAAKDNRIVVIHKENGGLSDARNAGLEICKGEYISFVDSDDWVADNYIEIMLNAGNKEEADIIVSKYIATTSDFSYKIRYISDKSQTLNSIEATKKLWSADETTFVTAWGKLYKTVLWKSIRFPKGFIHEDEYTTYKLLYSAKKTIFLDIPLYIYYQRCDSIMAGIRPSSIRVLKARWERYFYFKDRHEDELTKLCDIPLTWDLLFAYSQAKIYHKQILGFANAKELLKRLQIVTNSISNKKRIPYSLKLFAKIPLLYIIYRKIFPTHIREI